MGKIIYHDFRKAEREKEMAEIQERIYLRLFNIGSYNSKETQEQSLYDTIRYQQLKAEKAQWEELEKLNRKGNENETN